MSSEKVNNNTQQLHADIFKLLAACFYKPEKEILIENDLPGTLASLVKDVSGETYRGALQMKEAVKKYSIEELQVEYTRLFIGPFGVAVPPYGSYYLEKTGEVMGETTREVMQLYRKAGLAIDKEFTELPDHIAVELEFAYYLVTTINNPDVRDSENKYGILHALYTQFYSLYFIPFISAFSNRLLQETDNDFYLGLVICLREISDYANLSGG